MDGRASLYAVTFRSFCKGRLVPLILNTCLKTHQKKAKLLLVVLCSGLCWRASWQLASRVCLYQTLQRWPNCSALHLFLAQNAAIQWLITPSYWGGPVFRTRTGYPDERFSCGISVPRGYYRDCTLYLATIISFHILPNLFFTFHPNILRCVSRAAVRIDALTVIWVSVSLECSLTSFYICETSVRFIGYLDSCKVWPNENINARSV